MGIGDERRWKILVKGGYRHFRVPTVTDIHAAEEATMAAEYVDILQIPPLPADRPACTLPKPEPTIKTSSRKGSSSLFAMRFAGW